MLRAPRPWERSRRGRVARLRDEPTARHRVLVLVDRPRRMPTTIAGLLAADLEHVVNIDAIRAPASALRVIRADPHALDRYDAVVAITSPSGRLRRSSTALHREADLIASRRPTLLVRIGSTRRDPGAQERAEGRGRVTTLPLPAGAPVRTAARQIGTALRDLVERHADDRPASSASLRPVDAQEAVLRRLQHITRFAKEAFDLHAAAVNLRDHATLATFAIAGMAPERVPLDDSFCAIALRRPGITVIPDTHLDPEARQISHSRGEEAVRFYAAVPIHGAGGARIGTLCLYDRRPHPAPDLDHDLLVDLALLAEGELGEAAAAQD